MKEYVTEKSQSTKLCVTTHLRISMHACIKKKLYPEFAMRYQNWLCNIGKSGYTYIYIYTIRFKIVS